MLQIATAVVALFAFVSFALIVSIDVAGLTIAKSREFTERPQSLKWWAILNGLWHAGLLLVYSLVITGALDFLKISFRFVDVVADLLRNLNFFDLPDIINEVSIFVVQHIDVAAGIFGLAIVWSTYSKKIVDEPTSGSASDLPPLARFVLSVVSIFARLIMYSKVSRRGVENFINSNIQAALVAVDMLALALLIKNLGLMESAVNIFSMSLVIMITVTTICYLVGIVSIKNILNEPGKLKIRVQSNGVTYMSAEYLPSAWLRISLRLIEPWLIFYFCLELISYLLFNSQEHSLGFLFGASLMLIPLVRQHGLREVCEKAIVNSKPEMIAPEKLLSWRDMIPFIVEIARWLGIVCLIFICLVGVWSQIRPFTSSRSLDTILTAIFAATSAICIIFILLPTPFRKSIGEFLDFISNQIQAIVFAAIGVAVAAMSPIFTQITFAAGQDKFESMPKVCRYYLLGISENHAHAAQVVAFLLFIIAWVFSCRYILHQENHVVGNRTWKSLSGQANSALLAMPFGIAIALCIPLYFLNEGIILNYEKFVEFKPKACVIDRSIELISY